MGIENFFGKKSKESKETFDIESFVEDLQLKVKNVGGHTNFEYNNKKYSYSFGDIFRAEKTKMINGTDYVELMISAYDVINDTETNFDYFIYIKDTENPNGKIWISHLVGTSHRENIGLDDLDVQRINSMKEATSIITDILNEKAVNEKFIYRKSESIKTNDLPKNLEELKDNIQKGSGWDNNDRVMIPDRDK